MNREALVRVFSSAIGSDKNRAEDEGFNRRRSMDGATDLVKEERKTLGEPGVAIAEPELSSDVNDGVRKSLSAGNLARHGAPCNGQEGIMHLRRPSLRGGIRRGARHAWGNRREGEEVEALLVVHYVLVRACHHHLRRLKAAAMYKEVTADDSRWWQS